MVLKKVVSSVVLAGMLASAAPASTVGLARATQPFEIHRHDMTFQTDRNAPAVVQPGDRLVSRDGLVRVQTAGGESILLGEKSTATFADGSKLQLHEGEAAMAFKPGTGTCLEFDSLAVAPLKNTAEDTGSPKLVVKVTGENDIILVGFEEAFTVRDASQGVQVAVLGDREALRLVRDQLGRWQPLPLSLPRAQDDLEPIVDDEVRQDDDDDEGGFLFFESGTQAATVTLVGLGIGGLIIGGIVAFDELTDDDDDDDDDEDPVRRRATFILNEDEQDPIDEEFFF